MNIVVMIEGREALPVRSIPLLTDWHFMSPDAIAQVLAGDEEISLFFCGRLKAYRFESNRVMPVAERWWRSWPVRELEALSEKINVNESSHSAGYQQWRVESLAKLPPGVFVWKDDFEQFHARNWNARARSLQGSELSEYEIESADDADRLIELKAAMKKALDALEEWRELEFSPFISSVLHDIVLAGFDLVATTSGSSPSVESLDNSYHHATASSECEDDAQKHAQKTVGVPKFPMTKAGLIKAHEYEWPTIRRDIQGASTNGLAYARAGKRKWNEELALDWARSNGKLESPAEGVDPLTLAFSRNSTLPTRKHKIQH